jgi:hypothetical protein
MKRLLILLAFLLPLVLQAQTPVRTTRLTVDTVLLKSLSVIPVSPSTGIKLFDWMNRVTVRDSTGVKKKLLIDVDLATLRDTTGALYDSVALYAKKTTTISTTAPLTGGGDLSTNRTFAIPKATSTVDGYLAAVDWVIFNAKQGTLVNDQWYTAKDYVGNTINILKVTKDNTLMFGLPVEIQALHAVADAGLISIIDVPIVRANYGDTTGVKIKVDGVPILKVYSLADGAGSSYKREVKVEGKLWVLDTIVGTYSRFTKQIQADSINAVSKYLLNGVDIRRTGTLDTLAYKDQDNNFTVGQTVTDLYASDSITANSVNVADTLVANNLRFPTSPSNGYFWRSDARGVGSWQAITNAYKGTWNANTNTPTLEDGTGSAGDFYFVSVGDTINLGSGNIIFLTGGTCVYNGSIWEAVNPYQSVVSVNSLIGNVQLELVPVGDSVLTMTGGADSVNLNPPRFYQKELTADAENDIPVGFPIGSKTKVFYNGTLIEQARWSGVGTSTITLALDTRKYDVVTITN